ncbi:hypothetical protein J2782_000544 [Brucella pseudogrignonensis]|uniref:Uncharacterized protein n=1 Tax=Brucella pseudogrignonensis TaxID=419475 RepID=A0ABU1M475_9HYPH|nr:hypothetical protein [Brucella pseudogrignonensis]
MTALVWAQKSSFSDFAINYPKGRDFPGLFSCACNNSSYMLQTEVTWWKRPIFSHAMQFGRDFDGKNIDSHFFSGGINQKGLTT